jgi:hypothetical protein
MKSEEICIFSSKKSKFVKNVCLLLAHSTNCIASGWPSANAAERNWPSLVAKLFCWPVDTASVGDGHFFSGRTGLEGGRKNGVK